MNKITIKGELQKRVALNIERLEDGFYCAEEMFSDKNWQWPGDWVGRTMLAFLWHEELTGKKDKYFDDYVEQLRSHLNEDLFFGPKLSDSPLNEQAVVGNSWFMRAACKWYQNSGNAFAKEIIESMQKNLFYKLDSLIEAYPITRERNNLGGAMGELFVSDEKWQLSTDIGCVYIGLDGIAHAYEILRDEQGKRLLEKMIAHFAETDFVSCGFQTHATLSAARGIMKFYELTGEKKYLDLVRSVFDTYLKKGMTAHFSNFNWFGRNEWTELCAVVDSFMLAMRLYEHTDELSYLIIANQILSNALYPSQRQNGGFGCDQCPCESRSTFGISPENYEAYWCCTMRGAEGLGEAVTRTYRESAREKAVEICLYQPVDVYLEKENLRLQIDTDFPYQGEVRIRFDCEDKETEFSVALLWEPQEILCEGAEWERQGHRLVVRRIGSGELIVRFGLKTERASAFGKRCYDRGVLRLVEPADELYYRFADYTEVFDGHHLMSMPKTYLMDKETACRAVYRILFD